MDYSNKTKNINLKKFFALDEYLIDVAYLRNVFEDKRSKETYRGVLTINFLPDDVRIEKLKESSREDKDPYTYKYKFVLSDGSRFHYEEIIERQSKEDLRRFFEKEQLHKHFYSCYESAMDIFE